MNGCVKVTTMVLLCVPRSSLCARRNIQLCAVLPTVFLCSGLFVGKTEDPPGDVVRLEMADEDKVGALTRFVELLATIGSFLLVLVTLPFSLCFTFKVVQEYERAVVFRMGRLKSGAYGPGKRAYVISISLFVSKRTSCLGKLVRRRGENGLTLSLLCAGYTRHLLT